MNGQRCLTWGELADIQNFAESKFCYIGDEQELTESVFSFVDLYINGGKIAVFDAMNQILSVFDTLDDAIHYKEENEPKNDLWRIEVVES